MDLFCDIAIIGSGFAGSLTAMIARRLGRSVILLERGRHPRFVIGESSTPLANLVLEELANRYDLPRVAALCKWGPWQRNHPRIACGLKRGFTFYHHEFGQAFQSRADRGNELLVGASPHNEIADTHWYRPDFDHFLAQEAQSLGVQYFDEVALHQAEFDHGGCRLRGERAGERFLVNAQFVVDATGPRGFLSQALDLPEMDFPHLPPTQAIYSHFTGVRRFQDIVGETERASGKGSTGHGSVPPSDLLGGSDESSLSEHNPGPAMEATTIPVGESPSGAGESPALPNLPPYPPDDAALHHVFDGGWIWVLRFNNGITSAGVAMTPSLARRLTLSDGAAAWERLLRELPSVREQFAEAKPILPFVHAPRLSFRSSVVSGPSWALLPSAAGFIDPLLSTGFPLTLLGVERLARAFEEAWETEELSACLKAYERQTTEELLAAERLVAALYATMNDFPLFSALSLLYFAAASFSETARRLGKPEIARSFLLHDQPAFGDGLRKCCDLALSVANGHLKEVQRKELLGKILQAIEPIDVAGLSDFSRRNWYPAQAEDLLRAAPKLGVDEMAMRALLKRCGFTNG